MNAIDVHNLSLSLGQTPILKNVSFSVQENSSIAIIGPNGAGKSSLLKCLDRLHACWTGSITVKGRDLRQYSNRELARAVSYVPQMTTALPPFTVSEFIQMSRYAWDRKTPSDKQISLALERTGMDTMLERRLDTLSGGETQKLLIASALAQNAPIILLDEPTAFLDPKYQRDIRELLAQLKQDGMTIITVSHNLNAASASADYILAMKQGELLYHLPPSEIMVASRLKELYDTDFTFAKHPVTGNAIVIDG